MTVPRGATAEHGFGDPRPGATSRATCECRAARGRGPATTDRSRRRPRARVGPPPRARRRRARRRAAHDARQRRRPVRRTRRAPRRLGRLDEPLRPHRRAAHTSGRSASTRACCAKGARACVTAVEIRDEGAADALVVDGVLTSAMLVPENGPPQWDRPLVLDRRRAARRAGRRAFPIGSALHAVDALTVEMPLARHAAQSVGHPARRRGRVAHRPRGRARDGRRHDRRRAALPRTEPRRAGPRRGAKSIGTRADGTVLRVEVRDEGADACHRARGGDVSRGAMSARGAASTPGRSTRRRSRTSRSPKPRCELARSTTSTSRSPASPLGKDAAAQRPLDSASRGGRAARGIATVARCGRDRRAADHRHRRGLRRRGDGRRQVGAGARPGVVRRRRRRARRRARPAAPRARRAAARFRGRRRARCSTLPADLGHVSSSAARAGEPAPDRARGRRRLIVDGNNVIGSRPDGWWRDRPGAARRLVASLQALARRERRPDLASCSTARPLTDIPEGVHDGVLVAYATRAGRDAADDRIVDEVARDRDPASLVVVTSDRGLADRVRALGADVEGAGALLDRSTIAPGRGAGGQSRSGNGTPVTPSSRCTRMVFSAIDTRWYCPTVNTRSSSCCSSYRCGERGVGRVGEALVGVQLVGGAQQRRARTDPSRARRGRRRCARPRRR